MKNTKDLTIGAMFGAIYGIILILIRYLFTSSDSLIYYFLPLPLAIFTYWRGYKNGLILTIVLTILSFLICDPIRVLMLIIPNLLIGFIFGLLNKKGKGLLLIITFIVSLLANFLSVYAFEIITGISYLTSTVEEMKFLLDVFPNIDVNLIHNLIMIILPIVLILDAILKTILLYLVFMIICKRLKLDFEKMGLKITFSWLVIILYLISLIGVIIYFNVDSLRNNSIFGICILTIFFIINMYLMFLNAIGVKINLGSKNKKTFLIVLLSTIIFPIGVIFGIMYSIKYNNISISIG